MVKERDGRERVRDKNVEFFLCGTIWTNVKIVCGGISVFATYGGMCITHRFETRLEPAGRTGRTGNRWVDRFEHTFGSAMQLARREPVKIGQTR